MRNVLIEVAEKIKTHWVFNNSFSENRALCEIMWNNTVDYSQMPQIM